MQLTIISREFGRGKGSRNRFMTLAGASDFIKARWQGAEYCDSETAFHTDYCTYELRGFTLGQIGVFKWDGLDRSFVFNSDAKAKPVCTRRCTMEDCDGAHCRTCYTSEHLFCGQTVYSFDVCDATIARGEPILP